MIILFGHSILSAQEKFKVGIIAPLSGALAEYGLAAKNGIELARTQKPDSFSNVEFIFEDSQWDAKAAVAAFNKLRLDSKVSLVFNWGNPTTEAIAPIADRYQIPLLGMSLDPTVVKNREFVIRTTNSSADFSKILARYLVAQGYRRIGIVLVQNSYVQGLTDGLREAIGGGAEVEIMDSYNFQDQDFRSSISKIRTGKYDAIGVFLITGQISNFYRQLAAQSVEIPTFGTDFFESTNEIQQANGGMTGAVYPHLGVTESFRATYVSRFNNDYQLAYSGNAYDMTNIIGRLFNSKAYTSTQIIDLLRSVKDEQGVGGIFSFSNQPGMDPHYQFPIQLKKIIGDKISIISKLE